MDLTRDTQDVALPYEVSSEIWAKTIDSSAVMQLAQRVQLPGAGYEFNLITGDPQAEWAAEGTAKAVSTPDISSKKLKGYTLAVIVPFSNQFKRDLSTLYDEIVARAPQALGKKFDETVFGYGSVPGEEFDTFADVTEIAMSEGVWAALVSANQSVAENDGLLSGWVVSPTFQGELLSAVDGNGRPLFITSLQGEGATPNLLGHPAYVRKAISTVDGLLAVAGDWTSAVYGVVEDINVSISDQASIAIGSETVNLWANNMFAVRFEFEVGFRMKFDDHFAKIVESNA